MVAHIRSLHPASSETPAPLLKSWIAFLVSLGTQACAQNVNIINTQRVFVSDFSEMSSKFQSFLENDIHVFFRER
jgi:hypothetical protein